MGLACDLPDESMRPLLIYVKKDKIINLIKYHLFLSVKPSDQFCFEAPVLKSIRPHPDLHYFLSHLQSSFCELQTNCFIRENNLNNYEEV
jgi:hypothetical protein